MEVRVQNIPALGPPPKGGRPGPVVLAGPVPITTDSQQNPCLTFVTPTLLAGDRSLTDVVAHEIAHRYVSL